MTTAYTTDQLRQLTSYLGDGPIRQAQTAALNARGQFSDALTDHKDVTITELEQARREFIETHRAALELMDAVIEQMRGGEQE